MSPLRILIVAACLALVTLASLACSADLADRFIPGSSTAEERKAWSEGRNPYAERVTPEMVPASMLVGPTAEEFLTYELDRNQVQVIDETGQQIDPVLLRGTTGGGRAMVLRTGRATGNELPLTVLETSPLVLVVALEESALLAGLAAVREEPVFSVGALVAGPELTVRSGEVQIFPTHAGHFYKVARYIVLRGPDPPTEIGDLLHVVDVTEELIEIAAAADRPADSERGRGWFTEGFAIIFALFFIFLWPVDLPRIVKAAVGVAAYALPWWVLGISIIWIGISALKGGGK